MAPPALHLLFLNTYPAWGGGETWMLDIAEGLRARGHQCRIAGRRGRPWFERVRDLGWDPIELNIRGEFAPGAWVKLIRLYRRSQVDLVVCNFYKEVRIAGLARLGGNHPVIVNLKGLPLISDTFRHRFGYRHWIDHTVLCAEFIRAEFLRHSWIEPRKLSVIYNCYRPPDSPAAVPDLPAVRARLGIQGDGPVVGAVARFDRRKGVQDLIAAAPAVLARHPDTTFVIVGDGEKRQHLLDQAKESGIAGRVIFTGFRHDLDSIFPVFDLFVLPSHHEGFPYVTQIAMYHHKAIVATRVGGVGDAISDRVNGLLVAPEAPAQLAAAINLLLDQPDLRERLAAEGAATLRAKLSYSGMIDQFEALFRRLTAGGGIGQDGRSGPAADSRGGFE